MHHMDSTYFVVSEFNVQMLVSRYGILYAKWLEFDVNVKKVAQAIICNFYANVLSSET